MRIAAVAAVTSLTLVALAGCATPGTSPGTTPATTGVPTSASAPATTAAPASSTTPEALVTVPDVSGMNHQDAQDTMQAAGLYNLAEVDGTGKGRMLLVDRNWVQTGQDPAAGSKVPADTKVTLTAIKYTDR
jgi:hypothetical protein